MKKIVKMVRKEKKFHGILASPGMAKGSVYLFVEQSLDFEEYVIENVAGEIDRFHIASNTAIAELAALKDSVKNRQGDEFAHIFRSQQTIAEDESIIGEIEDRIREVKTNAESALSHVFGSYIMLFSELDDADYNKARVSDIEDVYKRILRILLGISDVNLAHIPQDSIIVARDLLPSDTILMDTNRIAGLITELGGATSHVAILANNLGIPAAAGVRGILESIQNNDVTTMDLSSSDEALIYVNPTEKTQQEFDNNKNKLKIRNALIQKDHDKSVITQDGVHITLSANVGTSSELNFAQESGVKSIGLYRSEFLFMGASSLPTEEMQYKAYCNAVKIFGDGFVVIRTLDIGGDKKLPALPLPKEDNPSLGNRALRLTLSCPDLFMTQIRAILRAGVHGNVKIMFPMVGGVPELTAALDIMHEAAQQLERESIPYDRSMEIGIMVEIPSAVWVADALAQRVSFFSIGTNDLTQYLLAADRLNSRISEYYRIFDPSIFRAIKEVVKAAEAHGRWVGVCGELGGNPLAIPALVGLGVTELSMSPRSVPEASWLIRKSTYKDDCLLADHVLELDTDSRIRQVLCDNYNSRK